MGMKSPRVGLRSPRPSVHRTRPSSRWRQTSLVLFAAITALFIMRSLPRNSEGAGSKDAEVRISVTRRLGMQEQRELPAGEDGVLSATQLDSAATEAGAEAAAAAESAEDGLVGSVSSIQQKQQQHDTGAADNLSTAATAEAAAGQGEDPVGAATAAAAALGEDEEEEEEQGEDEGMSEEEEEEEEGEGHGEEPEQKGDAAAGLGLEAHDVMTAGAAAGAAGGAAVGASKQTAGSAAFGGGSDEFENEGAGEDDEDEAAERLHASGSGDGASSAAGGSSSSEAADAVQLAGATAGAPVGGGYDEAVPEDGVPLSELERALRGCTTFDCLREAHTKPKHEQQFNFPHFLILGFPKCATTSLFHHLIQHPTIMAPRVKEPNFFTNRCQGDALACPPQEQEKYITQTLHLDIALQARLFMAVFEGSTHYSLAGEWLAPQLRELMPWVKLVLSLREPISRAISMLQHNLDHNRSPSCFDPQGSIFRCILAKLDDEEERYAPRLQAWVQAFPRQQLLVMQYENLTDPSSMKRVLRDVKRFVGIDAKLPHDDLGLHNSRKSGEGWSMTRREYRRLIELAREDAEDVAEIVGQHGFADSERWLSKWEKAWQRNLDACAPGADGLCNVQLT